MSIFQIKKYSFAYPLAEQPTLKDITLKLEEGKFYVLCGQSGCGKSTLLRQLKTVLALKGEKEGEILYKGKPLEEVSRREQSSEIGFVFQNPDNQIVTDKVWHELAFGLESLGYDSAQIHLRVAEMASYFGITDWFHRDVSELSGGQKQLLNLASVMVMHPKVLLLDEPTSQLDPVAAADFLHTLHKINVEFGITILLSEHNLEDVISFAEEVFVMEDGRIFAKGSPTQIGQQLREWKHEMFQSMPTPMRIYAETDSRDACPYTVAMGRQWLAKEMLGTVKQRLVLSEEKEKEQDDNVILRMKSVSFCYDKGLPETVREVSLKIYEGETFALLGGNGSGKTTTLHLMAGLLKPNRGEIYLRGKRLSKYLPQELYHGQISVLPQDPTSLFVKKTVEEELKAIPVHAESEKTYPEIVRVTQVSSLLTKHPYDLSGGEQQRVALAKVLLQQPKLLFLDEPTKGMDARFKQGLGLLLRKLNRRGVTIVLVSHDLEFCAKYTDRAGMFFDGSIAAVQQTRDFFAGNHFYTTAANRMARQFFPDAVTAEEVVELLAMSKKVPVRSVAAVPQQDDREEKDMLPPERQEDRAEDGKKVRLSQETQKHVKKYHMNAQKLVVLAVLTAIAVAGRAAFFMVPSIKPMAAVAILAGISLGAESGFLVGALSMLVSNMLFGQGPWTPWQMLAMGLIGLFAGVLARSGDWLQKRRWMCLYGFFAVLLFYGGIMNPASLVMVYHEITAETLLAIYLSGLPLDIVHAISTVVFLAVAGRPVLDKLERIKLRYNIK